MTVRVAVPLKLARLRIWVDKGRRWSAVDRLILWALSVETRTVGELSSAAMIPSRLIDEIIIRMMRFGWVELTAGSTGMAFQATDLGRSVVEEFDTLPPVTRRVPRRISFVLEPFTRSVFSLSNFRPYKPRELEAIEREYDVRRLVVEGDWSRLTSLDIHEAAAKALADATDDEELSSIDFNASVSHDQFALLSLAGKHIRGLPDGAPKELIDAVHKAAGATRGARVSIKSAVQPQPASRGPISMPALSANDLLLSGSDHRDILVEALRGARHHVLIHSTFLSADSFTELQGEFRRAAKRGANIDIFWGANKNEASRARNLGEAIQINKIIQADLDIRSRARVHMSSTKSHSKLLVADLGRPDTGFAVVGSCNWLSSWFNRIETSVVIRHAHGVARVAQVFGDLIYSAFPTSEAAGRLNRIARTLMKETARDGEASFELVLGDEHGVLIRRARDEAQSNILVGGDRLGLAAEARTIIPMVAAAKRSVTGTIYYSRPSGPVSRADARALADEARAAGVNLVEIPERELHGKFLLWDENDVVVSSLNWSSADTRAEFPTGEIGVHIRSPGLARSAISRLAAGWSTTGKTAS